MTRKNGYLFVFLFWLALCLAGALPFFFAGGLSPADAFFESCSSFSTVGATTLARVESLGSPLLLYRALACWVGGLVIIILSVALLPFFGVGAFQLTKTEGEVGGRTTVTPRMLRGAWLLAAVYSGFTVVLLVLYLAGGMSFFDALCHAASVVATAGVGTHNEGLSYYHSTYIEVITTVFMLLAAVNYNLYLAVYHRKWRNVWNNTELRAYIAIFIGAFALCAFSLSSYYHDGRAVSHAAFQTASILTTTGSAIADYDYWPPLAQTVLLFLALVGGCSGSSAGGVKVVRFAILMKEFRNELRRLVYPNAVFTVHLNKTIGRKDVVYSVTGYIFLSVVVISAVTLITAACGMDVYTSFSSAIAVTSTVGFGFGSVGPHGNYGDFPALLKVFYSLVMIAGRLELMAVFVFFTRAWRED